MKEEWSYKLVIDLSYEKTLQRIYTKEWLALQEKINALLEKNQFIPESYQVYRLQTSIQRQHLFRALETVLELHSLLLEQQWVLEFNLFFMFTHFLSNDIQLRCCDLPGVNKIWILREERLLNEHLMTQEYGHFCSVECKPNEKNVSQEELERLAYPLITRLKICCEKKQACILSDREFYSGQNVFVKLLALCFPESRIITLNAFAGRREPFKLLQPLIDYCNTEHQKNLPTSLGLWTLDYLNYYLAAELQELVVQEKNLILVIEENLCWDNELQNILKILLQLKITLFFTFQENPSLLLNHLKSADTMFLNLPEEMSMASLFRVFQTPLPKDFRDDFENFCYNALNPEEQKLLVFVKNTQALVSWQEIVSLWPEQRGSLERLLVLELITDKQGYLFVQGKFTAEFELLDMYRKLLDYWHQEKQQFDLEHLFFLSEYRLLSENDLLRGCQQLAERQMLMSLKQLARKRLEQEQSWSEYCNYLLYSLENKDKTYQIYPYEGHEDSASFLKALFYYEQGELGESRRWSQKLLLASPNDVQHPLYEDALLLQVRILTRQKKFLDARFLLEQIETGEQRSRLKKFLANFYFSVNLIYQNKLDKAETSLKNLVGQSLYLPYWEIYAHFLKVRWLFLCGKYKEASVLSGQLNKRAQQQNQPKWGKINYLWHLRSLTYLAEYEKVIQSCLELPSSCERNFMLAEAYLFSGKRRAAINILEPLINEETNVVSEQENGFQLFDALAHPHSYHALLQEAFLLLALAYIFERQINQADKYLRLYKLDKELSGCERFYYILFLKEKLNSNSYQRKHSLYLSHALSLVSRQLYSIENIELRAAVQKQNIWYRNISSADNSELEKIFFQ